MWNCDVCDKEGVKFNSLDVIIFLINYCIGCHTELVEVSYLTIAGKVQNS
jgi:hypothetical protein